MFITAIALATVGAIGLAVGTHLQHRAIRAQRATPDSLQSRGVAHAFTHPLWLLGMAIIVVATTLAIIALGFAPVALVQPVGALALVCAVLISTFALGVPLRRGLLLGIGLAVVSVAVFVGVSAGYALETRATDATVSLLSWLLLCLTLVGILTAHRRTGHLMRVACAGVIFGGVASAIHVVAVEAIAILHIGGAEAGTVSIPRLWGLVMLLGLAALIGMWLVQTAYASGPPETVLAGLTVIDPLTAVAIGAIVLGEYASVPPLVAAVLLASGVAAFVGVALIVRHHPALESSKFSSVEHALNGDAHSQSADTDGVAALSRRS